MNRLPGVRRPPVFVGGEMPAVLPSDASARYALKEQ